MKKPRSQLKLLFFSFISFYATLIFARTWECQIFPSEQKVEIDSTSGAKIIFITTDKASDTNLYFHNRCWLFDDGMMLFMSNRTGRSEVFGYIAKTGELVRLNRKQDAAAHTVVASRLGNRMYVARENAIYQWNIKLELSPKTKVHINEKKICDLPVNASQFGGMNENADASLVSFGYSIDGQQVIAVADVETGAIQEVARPPVQCGGHIQFSWNRPDLLMFNGSYGSDTAPLDADEAPHARIWFVNVNTKTPVPAFYQKPGELVTHECWWVNDQVTFIGGFRPEEAHVKVLDIKTDEIRIIGAGAWVEGVDAKELSKVNWWHASGSPDGRWVAGDNWHGIIALFDAKTTEKRILTSGHRTYGHGSHPHVGWDLFGKSVEFTSNKLGNPDVCIGMIPENWLRK
ncbi:MAG: hypothetical protein GWP06_00875 [Actinobacteria bacterium]|nr:hypothetical protein [Actinomycetota bacterium]